MNKIVPAVIITLALVAVFAFAPPIAKVAAILIAVPAAYLVWENSRTHALSSK